MTDLEAVRDHAHTMATLPQPITRWCTDVGPDGPYRRQVVVIPVPTPAERAVWRLVADLLDAHLPHLPEPREASAPVLDPGAAL